MKIDTSFMSHDICAKHIKNLHELSSSKRDNPVQPEVFVIDEPYKSGSIAAVDFDAVKEEVIKNKSYKGRPCSADALYCTLDKVYLIEFKTGKLQNALRKVYDSALLLIDNFDFTVQQIRENVIYIVVANKFAERNNTDYSITRVSELLTKPWNYPELMHRLEIKQMGLSDLDGVVVDKIYGMSPKQFDSFVNQENWY